MIEKLKKQNTWGQCLDKLNELIDAVNSLRDDCNLLMGYIAPENGCEPTDEDLRDMIKDPKYWKEQDPETVRKVELAFQKKYGETTQNSTNNSENSHLFQGNEQKVNKNAQKVNECEPEVKEKDPYAEQRQWIGKLCKVYDYNDFVHYAVLNKICDSSIYCYGTQVGDYQYCEPVKPDSELIYHGE